MKVVRREQCPKCAESGRDTSCDNLGVYSDGHSWCFACGYLEGTITSSETKSKIVLELPEVEEAPLSHKGLGISTLRAFKVFKEIDSPWYVYPYYDVEKKLVGVKYRNFEKQKKTGKKSIYYEGEVELFGFASVGNQKECIIWEGESDTLSGYQVNPYYAHLGVPGASTAEKLLKRHAYWLRNKFSKIYVVTHNDEPGQSIRAAVDEVLPSYLVKHGYVDSGFKDFNDLLLANRAAKDFSAIIKEAKSASDDYLLTGKSLKKSFLKYANNPELFAGYTTGFPNLDRMLGGGLHVGEVFALVGHTGRGKSTFARDIAMNISESLNDYERILWIGTEMSPDLMMRKFIERECGTPFTWIDGEPSIPTDVQDRVIDSLVKKFVFYTELMSDFDKVENSIISAVMQYNVRVVVIDVLSDISSDFTDWQKASSIISRLHKVAQGDTRERRPMIAILCVSHTVGSDEAEVTLSNLRGGSAIRQKITGAISFDGDINEQNRYIHRLKKSRVYDGDDDATETIVYYDKSTCRYYEREKPLSRKTRILELINDKEQSGTGTDEPLKRRKKRDVGV